MAEIVFILVIIYFVYVVNTAVVQAQENKKETNGSSIPPTVSVTETKSTETVKVKEEKVVAKPVKKAAVKKATPKKATTKKTQTIKKVAVEKTNMPTGTLRDPATGETDKIANNYRMLRRWIKEALVEEGFLENIYKTNELDDTASININSGLNELLKMDKYQ